MHQPVVAMTQQDQVVQVRRTAVDPVDHVMRDAPFRRSVAAGPLTVAVTNIERPVTESQLRTLLDTDETGAFSRDPEVSDGYTYVPSSS